MGVGGSGGGSGETVEATVCPAGFTTGSGIVSMLPPVIGISMAWIDIIRFRNSSSGWIVALMLPDTGTAGNVGSVAVTRSGRISGLPGVAAITVEPASGSARRFRSRGPWSVENADSA